MKKTTTILASLGILLLAGCSKPYNESLPAVQFNSVKPFGNDSVLLTGTVTSAGASGMDYVGFSYSHQPSFDLLSNQILLNGTTGQFNYAIAVKPDSTYYFKCFAANDFGYVQSSVFKYVATPPTADSATCGLAINEIKDGGSTYTNCFVYDGAGYATLGAFGVQANDITGYESVTIQFKMLPQQGTYTIQGNGMQFQSDNNNYEVFIQVTQGGFNTYTINSGGNLYVVQYPGGAISISFCSLTYTVSTFNVNISAKLNY